MTEGATAPAAIGSGWRRAGEAGLGFRPVVDADLPFLKRVYFSTRVDELAHVPWSDAQKTAFLEMQFNAQHKDYQANYLQAQWLVVYRGDEAIGRLYLDRWAREYRVIDIAFLPAHRGKGYGAALMQDLIDEAAAAGKAVSIHVEKNNPARRLYARLGFETVAEHGVYDRLERRPGVSQVNMA